MADDGDPGAGVRAVQLLDAVCNAQKGAVRAFIAHLGQVIADIGQHDAVKDDGPAHEEDGPAPERGSARGKTVQPLVEQHEAQIKGGVAHGHQVVVIDPGVEEIEGRGPQRQCGQIDEQEPKAGRVVPKGLLYEGGQQENGQQGKDQNVEHKPDREAVVQVKEEAEEAGEAAMQSRPEMERTDGVEALIVGQGGAGKSQNQLQGHSIDRSGQHTACQKPPRTAEGRGSAAAVKEQIVQQPDQKQGDGDGQISLIDAHGEPQAGCPREEGTPTRPGEQKRAEAGGQHGQTVAVGDVFIGKGGGDGGEDRDQSPGQHQRHRIFQVQQHRHADRRTSQEQQAQQQVQPWQVVIGAEPAGQREKIAAILQHLLGIVPEDEGIPVGEPVGHFIKVREQAEPEGGEKHEPPFGPEPAGKLRRQLIGVYHKNLRRSEWNEF